MTNDTLVSWLPRELGNLLTDSSATSSRLWTDTSLPSSYRLALATTIVIACIIVVMIVRMLWQRCATHSTVWLMDVATYTPPADWQVPFELFMQKAEHAFHWDKAALDFTGRILPQNGLGPCTAFPPGILQSVPPDLSLKAARDEAKKVLFDCVDQLLERNRLKATDIDILVVNCSLYNPTPSLSSMIVNHYRMRTDIQSYNLSGMGCSASIIALHLAKDLLKARPNCRCLVVSTENITQNIYMGREKSMQISNTLFRVGGAAILLSNRWQDASRAKFKLEHTVRTHLGSDDEAFHCVEQDTDADGLVGVRLDKSLMKVAARAVEKNLTQLGPLVLPYSEQARYVISFVRRMWAKRQAKAAAARRRAKMTPDDIAAAAAAAAQAAMNALPPVKGEHKAATAGGAASKASVLDTLPPLYTPKFSSALQHFCIHAGGRGVLDAIQAALQLSADQMAASRATLYRYGNTSSSSVWYELQELISSTSGRKLRRGERVWQLSFGSGFKCNSAIWIVR